MCIHSVTLNLLRLNPCTIVGSDLLVSICSLFPSVLGLFQRCHEATGLLTDFCELRQGSSRREEKRSQEKAAKKQKAQAEREKLKDKKEEPPPPQDPSEARRIRRAALEERAKAAAQNAFIYGMFDGEVKKCYGRMGMLMSQLLVAVLRRGIQMQRNSLPSCAPQESDCRSKSQTPNPKMHNANTCLLNLRPWTTGRTIRASASRAQPSSSASCNN